MTVKAVLRFVVLPERLVLLEMDPAEAESSR